MRDGLTGRAKFDAFARPLPPGIISPREHLLDLLADLQFSLSEAVELVGDERAGEYLRVMKLPLQFLYDQVNALMFQVTRT